MGAPRSGTWSNARRNRERPPQRRGVRRWGQHSVDGAAVTASREGALSTILSGGDRARADGPVLYAAFSLGGPQVPAEQVPLVDEWRKSITQIAREEMGHLATVENIIQFIGGALCFDRGDFPNASPYSPFAFELEPLTRVSLAKYVLAEAPARDTMGPELRAEIDAIENVIPKQAGTVNRVGLLYQAMIDLFKPMPMSVPTDVPTSIESADLVGDSVAYQARADEWGLGDDQVLILQARERQDAIDALTRVAQQGEGTTAPSLPLAGASHFQRFLAIYRQLPADGTWAPSRPLPTNPTASSKPDPDPAREGNRITNPVAQRWAPLGNVRYSLLLQFLSQAFSDRVSGRVRRAVVPRVAHQLGVR